LLSSCKVVEKGGYHLYGVYPRFRTYIFKSHLGLIPRMWSVLVEFFSTNSEGSGRWKKKERR